MPGFVAEILDWAKTVSPGFFLVSLLLPVGFAFRRRRWWLWVTALLVAQVVADAFGAATPAGVAGLAIDAGAVFFLVRGWRESRRFQAAWEKRFRAEEPVALRAPFEGRWKALNTGPSLTRNPHLVARDQWFAVDWMCVEGESRGSRILAPADGVVAYVEDGREDKPVRKWVQRDFAHPAGNYVSLRLAGREAGGEDVFVILAHLEQGSICVRVGERVRAGDAIGRCGNSGNTSVPHLHIHAQPAERFAAGSVWGVPVRYGRLEGWMRHGEILEGT